MQWPLYPQERTLVLVEVEAGWTSELIWKRKFLAPARI
jgi:hypothetical protein